MPTPKPPTSLEKHAGHIVTEAGLTLAAALSGTPVAALLPVLAKSLASERHKERVERALTDISTTLEAHSEQLRTLSDSQYKFINEAVLAVLHTTSETKIAYLRRAIRNGLATADLQPEEAVVLARVIRDISAEEADFLIEHFEHERIQVGTAEGLDSLRALVIPTGGREELIINGLIALGLIVAAGPTVEDLGQMRFSNAVAKVIALLREPSA